MFYSLVDYIIHSSKENRRDKVLERIINFFDTTDESSYYIMDPYLDIMKSIQAPLIASQIDDHPWILLISLLAAQDVKFKIITRERTDSIPPDDFPLYTVPIPPKGSTIEVCYYMNNNYHGLAIHDRYIIKSRNEEIKGLHIGPSLADIHDKDVSLTIYSNNGALQAKKSFIELWEACILNKGWKKG